MMCRVPLASSARVKTSRQVALSEPPLTLLRTDCRLRALSASDTWSLQRTRTTRKRDNELMKIGTHEGARGGTGNFVSRSRSGHISSLPGGLARLWTVGAQRLEVRQWFQDLMQADNPLLSRCGEADAYWADSVEVDEGRYVAISTDEGPNGPLGRMRRQVGERASLPAASDQPSPVVERRAKAPYGPRAGVLN
jgi:hypothetical protein